MMMGLCVSLLGSPLRPRWLWNNGLLLIRINLAEITWVTHLL
jgi:hypothetical protein